MNNKEWYETILEVGVVAGCIIFEDDKYLLVQENQEKAYGLWNIPAGHVDKGESLKNAAVREALEETGLKVEIIEEIAIYHEEAHKSIKHVYSVKVVGGELKAQEGEIMDVKWLSFEGVQKLHEENKLRKPWVWDIINKHHTQFIEES